MGSIFSSISLRSKKKKSSKEALESIETELKSLSKSKEESQQHERTVAVILLIVALLIYPVILIVGVIVWLWFPNLMSKEFITVYSFLLIGLPVMLYGVKKITNIICANKKTKYNALIKSLHEEKRKILDEVMETEPYKVAKELLDKYDPQSPKNHPTANQPPQSTVRQRRPPQPPPPAQNPHPALQHQTPLRSTVQQPPPNTPLPQPLAQQQVAATPLPGDNVNSTNTPLPHSQSFTGGRPAGQQYIPPGHSIGVAPGPPTPVPILPRDRTGVDKVLDFMLGDGPKNRYALVCSECHSHNGMALKDEFEYLSFRCAYCYTLNQARKSRPQPKRSSQSHLVPEDSEVEIKNTGKTLEDSGKIEPGDND